MDKWQALQKFWESFGIPAYDATQVPIQAAGGVLGVQTANPPYITYEANTGAFNEPVALNASLWYYSQSWAAISQKADEISRAIGMGGIWVSYDGGCIWIKRGTPFAQRMSDEDINIRRIVLNIEAEFSSEN